MKEKVSSFCNGAEALVARCRPTIVGGGQARRPAIQAWLLMILCGTGRCCNSWMGGDNLYRLVHTNGDGSGKNKRVNAIALVSTGFVLMACQAGIHLPRNSL